MIMSTNKVLGFVVTKLARTPKFKVKASFKLCLFNLLVRYIISMDSAVIPGYGSSKKNTVTQYIIMIIDVSCC